ncbi:kynureninase [Tenuibacillus multivorans]|uniref:Kynureninase n=1 Tax=Tenuibacillus multivorans TaxID=237069 RepID=A0A1G9WSI9_9BACI|nr:kynureninase [Tenuibacillus multivorans]GEL77945.1 kynureninase [Tenuibacillus multivorans]SDM87418.1 kynureninase [Tenuibacillus multivorans]
MFDITEEFAKQLDAQDPLKGYKDEFYIKANQIYMDGNSLGLMSKRAEQSVLNVMNAWKKYGIDGWTQGDYPWFYLSENLGEKAAPLVGAKPEEVVVTGSTTTNLHQLVATFYQPKGKRTKILADELNFPSDIYALKSQIKLHGLDPDEHLIRVKSRDGRSLDEEDIIAAMGDDIALVVLPTVLYRSGQLLDIERLTKAAHERDILIGWDGCHSVGAIPHQFHEVGADFAFWCHYKYVNNGPGGVAGLFVHERHFDTEPKLAGWFGSDKQKQFDMEHDFTPAESAGAFQIGTPHVLSVAPLIGSLELFNEVGIEAIRQKSLNATSYLMYLVDELLSEYGFTIGNPRDDEHRGGHVCLEHKEAASICKALKDHHIIPDFRAPNVIRLAPVAFYVSYHDVYQTVMTIKDIMENQTYKQYKNERDIIA